MAAVSTANLYRDKSRISGQLKACEQKLNQCSIKTKGLKEETEQNNTKLKELRNLRKTCTEANDVLMTSAAATYQRKIETLKEKNSKLERKLKDIEHEVQWLTLRKTNLEAELDMVVKKLSENDSQELSDSEVDQASALLSTVQLEDKQGKFFFSSLI